MKMRIDIKGTASYSPKAINAKDFNLINTVTDGLNDVLDYIWDNYESMNLDGIFGVVFAKAHLNSIRNNVHNSNGIQSIDILSHKCDNILYATISSLENLSPKHKLFCDRIMNPTVWTRQLPLDNKLRFIKEYDLTKNIPMNPEKFIFYLNAGEMDATISDKCLVDLLYMQEPDVNDMPHNCSITGDCRYHMIDNEDIDPGYGVTHRLLYLQVARSQNCIMHSPFVNNLINSYCSYIYWELKTNKQMGFISRLDDLLLEQVTLCGFEGYAEFFSLPIIEHVINMQTQFGCFTVPKHIGEEKWKKDANYIKYGCNDHTTGLGASTLSLILRYLLEKK